MPPLKIFGRPLTDLELYVVETQGIVDQEGALGRLVLLVVRHEQEAIRAARDQWVADCEAKRKKRQEEREEREEREAQLYDPPMVAPLPPNPRPGLPTPAPTLPQQPGHRPVVPPGQAKKDQPKSKPAKGRGKGKP